MKFRRLIFWPFCSVFILLQTHNNPDRQSGYSLLETALLFYWNIPKTVELMAHDRGLQWDVDQATLGGASLEQHWKGLRG